jgi:hypothetical protein
MKRVEITLADHPKQAPYPTYETVDQQTVVINLDAGAYISLNETGSFLWERLDGKRTLADIAQELAEMYNVAPDITRPDVLALAQVLLKEKYIILS